MTTTSFSCAHTATTTSTHTPNPHLPTAAATSYPPPRTLPFPCRPCARDAAQRAESAIRATYDPPIAEMRAVIENALWHLTRDNPGLKEAIERKQGEEMRLMVRKERELIACWREFRERWE